MKKRCYYKSHISYPKYGGIGISVCEEWKRDFTAFQNWALENGYDDTKQIDRIDVNGNYEPANCRWVSRKENMRNRHNTVFVSYDGKLVPFVELCETFGVKEGNARAFFRNHNRDEAQLISYLKRKANV